MTNTNKQQPVTSNEMTSYIGIIRIRCTRRRGCLRNLHRDVQPGCMDCPEAVTEILNLDNKVIYTYRSPAARTGKRAKE